MHDTLKKPREILMAVYAVRSPELAAKSKVAGELDVDPNVRRLSRSRVFISFDVSNRKSNMIAKDS